MPRLIMFGLLIGGLTLVAVAALAQSNGAAAAPTCSHIEFLDVDQHGDHIIRDYVIGMDGTGPGGGEGVEVKGGPGPGFHFVEGFAPGASFCTNSQSPGNHFPP